MKEITRKSELDTLCANLGVEFIPLWSRVRKAQQNLYNMHHGLKGHHEPFILTKEELYVVQWCLEIAGEL